MKPPNICQDVSRLPGRLPHETHFSWKNSIEHLSISCVQFNLIYKTLHNVTFSIKNKWCRPDIWRVDSYFLQAFWLSSATHPDFQCWESQTEKYQSQLNNLWLCICGDFCFWRSVDSRSPPIQTKFLLVTSPTEKWECLRKYPSHSWNSH